MGLWFSCTTSVRAAHPRLLIRAEQRDEIRAKVEDVAWVNRAFQAIQKRVDVVADKVEEDPDWLVSRLMMNWETRYTLPVTRDSKWIGGEGRAPVPTPRFAGARDWNSDYGVPPKIEDWKEYNGRGDDVRLWNPEEKSWAWVHPSQTGRVIESVNLHIMKIAAEAAFLHWVTGEERYAKVALPVLWTYMDGFQHVLPPRIEDPDSGSAKIIGTTSFEVIHEDILMRISECYDFIHPYLVESGKDSEVIQRGIKRMVDRIIEGGLREGNWNLFQAKMITHGALVLEPNEHYSDGRGRGYYVDVVLHADQPSQLGLIQVVEEGYDPETAIWPEAPGYGFETTASILGIANLLALEPGGRELLDHPQLERAMLVQAELVHPNGLSIGLGDTTNVRINMEALELLISAARKLGKEEQERRLTALLMKEITTKRYMRWKQATLLAVTGYVAELHDVVPYAPEPMRTFWAAPLNVLMMHLDGDDPASDLSAAMYGTAGGHAHANGLAIELYGAGHILAPDPGRGVSYWQSDQRHYYSRMAAHNTVIPNGYAIYSPEGPGQLAMEVMAVEPETGASGLSERIGFAQASFKHLRPATDQRRTLAVVRIDGHTGFYFDVFRSRMEDQKKERYHDFLYHGQAQKVELMDHDGVGLSLKRCELLGEEHGHLPGYDFFQEERSVGFDGGFRARFPLEFADGSTSTMDMWMLASEERQIFTMEAPQNRAIRRGLPKELESLPMPTVIVRQHGEAWRRPFSAVYEPYFKEEGAWIQRVIRLEGDTGMVAMCVEGIESSVLLMDGMEQDRVGKADGICFSGVFGAAIVTKGRLDELYLGHGRLLKFGGFRVEAEGTEPVTACLKRGADGEWLCKSSGPVRWTATDTAELPKGFD